MHRQNWPRGNESIQGAITLQQNGDAWDASYTVEFRNENAKGDWQFGLVDITIEIRPFKAGYLITSHKAKVHDLKHGSALPSPKSAEDRKPHQIGASDVTRPRYVVLTTNPSLPENARVRDVISSAKGFAFERTFMTFGGSNTVLTACRVTYNATVTTSTTGATVRVTGWKWDASFGNDKTLQSTVERVADTMVGSTVQFRFNAGEMTEVQSGMTFSLEK